MDLNISPASTLNILWGTILAFNLLQIDVQREEAVQSAQAVNNILMTGMPTKLTEHNANAFRMFIGSIQSIAATTSTDILANTDLEPEEFVLFLFIYRRFYKLYQLPYMTVVVN